MTKPIFDRLLRGGVAPPKRDERDRQTCGGEMALTRGFPPVFVVFARPFKHAAAIGGTKCGKATA
jgi:hypothetical protein